MKKLIKPIKKLNLSVIAYGGDKCDGSGCGLTW